ncbi:DUF1616 domain-containing protein [Chloroflexota bacterium]
MDWLSPIRGIIEAVIPLFNSLPFLRVILGSVLVFLLPGFAWTLVFFDWHRINIIERLALSLGLSIALVTLSILALNIVFDVSVTGLNAVLIILVVTAIAVIVYYLKRVIRRHRQDIE